MLLLYLVCGFNWGWLVVYVYWMKFIWCLLFVGYCVCFCVTFDCASALICICLVYFVVWFVLLIVSVLVWAFLCFVFGLAVDFFKWLLTLLRHDWGSYSWCGFDCLFGLVGLVCFVLLLYIRWVCCYYVATIGVVDVLDAVYLFVDWCGLPDMEFFACLT